MNVLKLEEKLHFFPFLFEILGLQYFSLKKLTSSNVNQCPSLWRKLQIVIMIALVILIFLSMICISLVRSEKNDEAIMNKNILMTFLRKSMKFNWITYFVLSLTYSFTSTREVKMFYLNSREVMQMIYQDFNVTMDTQNINKAAWKRFVAVTTLFFLNYGTLFFQESGLITLLIRLLLGFPALVYFIMSFYRFLFLVEIVNSQLELLNSVLTSQFSSGEPQNAGNLIEHKVIISARPNNVSSSVLLYKIKTARKVFNLIQENGDHINSSNGLTVFAYLTLMMAISTSKCYDFFVLSMGDLPANQYYTAASIFVLSIAVISSTASYCQKTITLVRCTSHFTVIPSIVLSFFRRMKNLQKGLKTSKATCMIS